MIVIKLVKKILFIMAPILLHIVYYWWHLHFLVDAHFVLQSYLKNHCPTDKLSLLAYDTLIVVVFGTHAQFK